MLNKGINIGDHFESNIWPGVEFTYPIEDWYFKTLAKLEFDHVRLPVRWSAHTDDANGYKIDSTFMGYVKKAVDEFIAHGYSIILNVHHFGGANQNPKSHQDKLYAMWRQIGAEFAHYPDELIFEVMNEPQHMVSATDWNEVQNKAVSVIRETNPLRKIMIGGVDWNGYRGLIQVEPPNDENLIATFHYYEPTPFTHQGAKWSPENYGYKDVKWNGTKAESDIVDENFKKVYDWSRKYGIEINLGEFGAYSTGDMESRARWTKCVRETAEKYGFSFTYWEFNHGFGICDKQTHEFRQPLVDALFN